MKPAANAWRDKRSLQAHAWQVACPRCSAAPDTECSSGGLLTGRYHRERHLAALTAQDARRSWKVTRLPKAVAHNR